MAEVFLSQLTVIDRREALQREPELAQKAEEWFGGAVRKLSVEVSLDRVDGILRYVVAARFCAAASERPVGRLETVARWLGLVRPPTPPAIG